MHQPRHPPTQPTGANAEAHKTVVRRLVEEVMNAGRLDLVDELYTPELAAVRDAG